MTCGRGDRPEPGSLPVRTTRLFFPGTRRHVHRGLPSAHDASGAHGQRPPGGMGPPPRRSTDRGHKPLHRVHGDDAGLPGGRPPAIPCGFSDVWDIVEGTAPVHCPVPTHGQIPPQPPGLWNPGHRLTRVLAFQLAWRSSLRLVIMTGAVTDMLTERRRHVRAELVFPSLRHGATLRAPLPGHPAPGGQGAGERHEEGKA